MRRKMDRAGKGGGESCLVPGRAMVVVDVQKALWHALPGRGCHKDEVGPAVTGEWIADIQSAPGWNSDEALVLPDSSSLSGEPSLPLCGAGVSALR